MGGQHTPRVFSPLTPDPYPLFMDLRKWLTPGLQVKRWLLVLGLGVMCLALGLAYILVYLYRTQAAPPILYYLTLQFVPRLVRASLFIALGGGLIGLGLLRLNQSLMAATARVATGTPLLDALYRRRTQRGPRIVAIGGGTGLSTLLRGLKQYTANITAIVTVADDGGSSGRLRRQLGVPPPGDFRQCIAALAEAEPLMTQLFEYRFEGGDGIAGHSFGNLFIVAMQRITGSFESALRESSRVLNVAGRILPATLQDVTLSAELVNAEVVHGESAVPHGGAAIHRVFLQPEAPAAYPEAVQAILDADLLIIGPGSLYTSVLPNLLVPGLTEAIRQTGALRVYVVNVASQPGETDGYVLSDYLAALERHIGRLPVDKVLVNHHLVPLPPEWGVTQVGPDEAAARHGVPVVAADLLNLARPTRHDPARLAAQLVALYSSERHTAGVAKNGQNGAH